MSMTKRFHVLVNQQGIVPHCVFTTPEEAVNAFNRRSDKAQQGLSVDQVDFTYVELDVVLQSDGTDDMWVEAVRVCAKEFTTKNCLKELKAAHKVLLAAPLDSLTFWLAHENFVKLLRDFLGENRNWAVNSSKKDILYVIGLCSTFRPIEPHRILSSIADQHHYMVKS